MRTEADPYLPGEIIENKYRLVRPLGEGGMGTVWVGHNVVLDVHVAIKLINVREGKSASSSERLLQEARAAARLGHPAIVRVFDFGRTRRGDPFVVMELIRGVTLFDHAQREQRLPAIRAVQLMLPIADALAVAHGKGIIHRDVKPENVILATDEAGRIQPKLLDFGIASMVETNKRLTLEGTVLGTPDYMSPEQARGRNDLDHRTDVWSFSVMLYELLTGRLPFTGANYNALLWSIINEDARPVTEFAAGDKQLWRVIERGFMKSPTERWETMRVMGEALALWLYERGVREDVCAASLKTSWLEAGLTGVRIEVSSLKPDKEDDGERSSPRETRDTAQLSGLFERFASDTIVTRAPSDGEFTPRKGSAESGSFDETSSSRSARKRRKLGVIAAVSLVALATAGAVWLRSPAPVLQPPASPDVLARTAAKRPAPAELAKPVLVAAPPTAERQAEVLAPKPAVETKPAAAVARKRSGGDSSAAAKRPVESSAKATATEPRAKNYDFGF